MSKWWEGELVVFDTETTGKDYEEARIVSAFIGSVHNDGSETDAWTFCINPGVPIPAGATEIHGITDEMASAYPEPKDVLPGIVNILTMALDQGVPLVAFNGRYDFTVLDRDCRRHGITTLSERTAGLIRPVLDPYVLDKAVDRYRKGSRKLEDMCTHYGVALTNAHEASADAIAAGHLARAIVKKHTGLQMPVEQLHNAQRIFALQQAISLQRHLRQKHNDPDIRCELVWPIVPFEKELVP